MEKYQNTIKINPVKVTISLLIISLVVILLSFFGQREFQTGNPVSKFFLEMYKAEFYINKGENVSTYWNMFLLIIMSALATAIAVVKQATKAAYRSEWWILSVLFLFFAIDELSTIHQRLIKLLIEMPTMLDWQNYKWLYVVAGILVIALLVFLVRFYIHLDNKNKVLFPISLVLYIFGEYRGLLFGGFYAELHNPQHPMYLLITHAEEFIEYTGIILMIYMLFGYFSTHISEIEFLTQEPEKK
ncbi:MAG: hypothetical protein U0Z26_17905 [Anaerolineales bacterium]